MNKIIRKKCANYTVISNVFVRDNRLSLKAKGLMAVVMSLPEDWNFSVGGLMSVINEGKSAIYSAVKELKQYGYCEVVPVRDEKGKMAGNDYIFSEESQEQKEEQKDTESKEQPHTDYPHPENPHADNPHTENPHPDYPRAENRTQLNKDLTKYRLNISPPISPPKGYEDYDFSFIDERFIEMFFSWLDYKRERKEKKYTKKGIKALYKKIIDDSSGDPEIAKRMAEQSYANNWSGIFKLKQEYAADTYKNNSSVEQRREDAASIIARRLAQDDARR